MTVLADIQKLEPGSRITLYEVNATALGGGSLYFHAHLQSGTITWQGQAYDPWPVEALGFERTSSQQPTPTLKVGNVDGTITALCLALDDMVGAVVTRRRTFAKYLDAVNFGGTNPTADPTEYFPNEIWFVERKASEDRDVVEFELASAMDFSGQQLPGRQIIAGSCSWTTRGGYRGPYCGYTGPPVATITDAPTSDPSLDVCGGRVASCKLRFGATNPLNFGGEPAAGLLR